MGKSKFRLSQRSYRQLPCVPSEQQFRSVDIPLQSTDTGDGRGRTYCRRAVARRRGEPGPRTPATRWAEGGGPRWKVPPSSLARSCTPAPMPCTPFSVSVITCARRPCPPSQPRARLSVRRSLQQGSNTCAYYAPSAAAKIRRSPGTTPATASSQASLHWVHDQCACGLSEVRCGAERGRTEWCNPWWGGVVWGWRAATLAFVVTSFTEVRKAEREERLVEVRGPGLWAPPAPAPAAPSPAPAAPPSPGGLPPSASADTSRACTKHAAALRR